MFNGIVYNQGLIKSLRKNPKYVNGSLVVEIVSDISFKKNDIGESVCCNGVCLTLIRIKKKSFLFYLSKETLNRSNFKNIKVGKYINIEKSLYHGKKISGHYIQGHVDTTAVVKNIKIIDRSWNVIFSLEKKNKKYIVEKGSVSINGVSLTVSKIGGKSFQITIIPHTLKLTNLINLKRGDKVNVEFDIVGKYLNNIYS
ncbi:MAG: riboflavin synthase [Pelagibacteraceae bacterium TMED247]|nr:riboflavin synthase [Candidatus Pelagibacter sp.]RPG05788.1 MAG: riboflavin synthase [Pelagibacteraceae bacterium TMED247]|tara:strand:- start:18944 stop:19540 length:597 start_codon:yes stop_codon:yes gene_type:complete